MSFTAAIERDGFAIVSDVISAEAVSELINVVESANFVRSIRGDETYGARNILSVPEIARLAYATRITQLVSDAIGDTHKAVRGIFFDKLPGANWPVAWHQDLSLAVSKRHDVSNWGNWSIKAGVQHVQPPAEVLARMITLRIQLDDSGADNGPLRVIPGSHALGRVTADKMKSLRAEIREVICTAPAGSALAMKPLILHASSAAKNPSHRRVIHIEYAPEDLLPDELAWAFVT